MAPSAAPPSPQEVSRKLSMHSAPKPSVLKEKPSNLSSHAAEPDADSAIASDYLGVSSSTVQGAASSSFIPGSSPGSHPLTSIAEKGDGSGAEDTEDEDELDEGEGGWKTPPIRSQGDNSAVIKTGYLWKKGERRKTWKKRWFVLRTAHLAYYKTAAEYKLLRLLQLSDVHSCTKVSLKRHDHTFGLVSPVRTFYLQASSPSEVQEWVTAIEETRQRLQMTSSQTSVTTPIPIPTRSGYTSSPPNPATPSPPTHAHPSFHQPVPSSDSEDATTSHRTYSMSSQQRPDIGASPAKTTTAPSKEPGKTILSAYLMKCGSKRKNWRKRWFVLTAEKLWYSASHMDTKPHRQFPFSEIIDALEYDLSSATDPEIGDPENAHTFKIVTTKRTLLLCAPGEEDEIKWLGAIRALIARRLESGGVPGERVHGSTMTTATTSSSVSGPGSVLSSDVSPPSSNFASPSGQIASPGGSGGLKGKVRRLSASSGVALGKTPHEPSAGAH